MTVKTHTPLRILVAESHRGAAAHVVHALRERGHELLSCTPPEGSSAPCIGLSPEGECPLDEHVDVVVVAHDSADVRQGHIATSELPAVCAMRREVPIVAVSATPDRKERAPWPSAHADDDNVVDVCEAIGRQPHRNSP